MSNKKKAVVTEIKQIDTLADLHLFEPPFTDIASNGLIDVFRQEQATQIVRLVEKVNGNAVAV